MITVLSGSENPTLVTRSRWAITDSVILARRDLTRSMRDPEMTSFAVIMGVFFLLLFNYVFGGAIGAGTGVDYTQFLVPGVLVITALTGSLMTGTGLAVDLSEGVDRRFRSLPMSRVAVVAGRTISDSVRNTVSVLLVIAVGYLMGFRFASVGGAFLSIALVIGLGFSFSWISAAIALKLRNPEAVNMASMFWLFPLMFASTVFTPVDTMPGWLQPLASNQPLSVVADAVRGLAVGDPAGSEIALSLAWIVGLLLVFVPLSTRSYNKGA
jgi:ABC transporter DrrB family efflux protein